MLWPLNLIKQWVDDQESWKFKVLAEARSDGEIISINICANNSDDLFASITYDADPNLISILYFYPSPWYHGFAESKKCMTFGERLIHDPEFFEWLDDGITTLSKGL